MPPTHWSRSVNTLAHFFLLHRWLPGLTIIAACCAAAVGVTRLSFDDNYKDIFRSGDERYERFVKLADTFGAGDGDCVILLQSRNMLSREALAAVRQIHMEIAELPEAES